MILITKKLRKEFPSGENNLVILDDISFNLEEGKSLANSVCLPKGYNQGEIPTIPTVILTTFEINNIREINDKKMTVTFEFYQELTWIDDRISANFRHPSNWGLTINKLTPDDAGMYLCQLSTFPARALFVFLEIQGKFRHHELLHFSSSFEFYSPLVSNVFNLIL